MKTLEIKTVSALLIVLLLLTGSNSMAQETHKNCSKMDKIPNLTDEQKAKIEKLKVAHLKEILPLKNQMQEKKAHLNTLTTAEKTDMEAINKTIDEIGSLKTEMMKKTVNHRLEVRNALTDEQRVFFDMHQGCLGDHEEKSAGCSKAGKVHSAGQEHKGCKGNPK